MMTYQIGDRCDFGKRVDINEQSKAGWVRHLYYDWHRSRRLQLVGDVSWTTTEEIADMLKYETGRYPLYERDYTRRSFREMMRRI